MIAIKSGQGAGSNDIQKGVVAGQFSILPPGDGAERVFPLCLGTSPEEKTLLLGAVPRTAGVPRESPKKGEKRR